MACKGECLKVGEMRKYMMIAFTVLIGWLGWLTIDHLSMKYDNTRLLTEVKALSEFTAKTVDELKQEIRKMKDK